MTLTLTNYEEQNRQVRWCGVSIVEGDVFDSFISNDVVSRLNDEEGNRDFETHLRGIAITGFARESLSEVLMYEILEDRTWAIGEAFAEAYLEREFCVKWPWNMLRDVRVPNASLPGADLVGFEIKDDVTRLVFGEVKTSSDENNPPNVMYGRSGMTHQIDNLAHDLGIVNKLLKWLWFRCKGAEHEESFNAALSLFLESGNKAVALFGVLIRDTGPNELDLRTRGQSLAEALQTPTTCHLVAIYLPCSVDELPSRVSGGAS